MLTFRKWMNARTGRDESGFSLLELVVAVGVILILTVIGMISYTGLTHNARVAAVESAAEKTYKAASAAEASDGSWSSIEKVQDDWNASQDQTRVEISQDSQGRLCVSASFLNNDDVPDAHRGIGGACGENGENAGNGGENGENSGDPVSINTEIEVIATMTPADAFSAGVISEVIPAECSERYAGDCPGVLQNASLSALRVIDRTTGEVIGSTSSFSYAEFSASYSGEEYAWTTTGDGDITVGAPITIAAPSLLGLLLTIEMDAPNGEVITHDLPFGTEPYGEYGGITYIGAGNEAWLEPNGGRSIDIQFAVNGGNGGENSSEPRSINTDLDLSFAMSNADAVSSGVISALPGSECYEDERDFCDGNWLDASLSAVRVIDRTTGEVIGSASASGYFNAEYSGEAYDWTTTGNGAVSLYGTPITITAPSLLGLLLSVELEAPNGEVFTYDLPTETMSWGGGSFGVDYGSGYVYFTVSN